MISTTPRALTQSIYVKHVPQVRRTVVKGIMKNFTLETAEHLGVLQKVSYQV